MGYANILGSRIAQMMDKDYSRECDRRIDFNIHVTDSEGDIAIIFRGNTEQGEKDCYQKHTDDGGAPMGFKMFIDRALPYPVAQALLEVYKVKMSEYLDRRNKAGLLDQNQKVYKRREARKLWSKLDLKGDELDSMIPFPEVAHLE